ncbi:MAG: hypothetical protein EPN43_04220 [Jatrophihabitans sp.]|nr:MAG: hypothetical protein EPN43_04220 [Jatrophihabitans sp.]
MWRGRRSGHDRAGPRCALVNAAIAWAALGTALLLSGPVRRAAPVRSAGRARTAGAVTGLCVTVALVVLVGRAGLAAAVVLGPPAAIGAARLAGRRPARPDRGLALAIDLVAAALQAGQPLPRALELAAPATGPPTAAELRQVARLLALGAAPDEAWRGVDPHLVPMATAARRSERSGARLAANLTDLAADLRAAGRAGALARAHRAGVLALLPLGLCFLPAFVCLGIVPSVAGLLTGVLGSLP